MLDNTFNHVLVGKNLEHFQKHHMKKQLIMHKKQTPNYFIIKIKKVKVGAGRKKIGCSFVQPVIVF